MKSREEQDPKVLKQKKALYERIMKSVATEVKKILNENVVTDIIGKKIKEIIYNYFEKKQGMISMPDIWIHLVNMMTMLNGLKEIIGAKVKTLYTIMCSDLSVINMIR